MTCAQFDASPELYTRSTVRLAGRVHLNTSRFHVILRLRNALTDICARAPDPDAYRPAADALDAVRAGRYKTARG